MLHPVSFISLPWLLRLLQRVEFPRKLGVCERLFQRRLRDGGMAWARTPGGHLWKVDLAIPSHRWLVYGRAQRGLTALLRRRLSDDAVIVDSGANIGQMLVTLVENVPFRRYLAFEPGAEAADWLRQCLGVNPDLKVEVLPTALGEGEGTSALAMPVGGHGCQAFLAEQGDAMVPVARLADALARLGEKRVDFWKLDVEGHELEALKGAEPLLATGAIRLLYVEILRRLSAPIRDYLQGFGYRCCNVNEWGGLCPFRDADEELADVLFLREQDLPPF